MTERLEPAPYRSTPVFDEASLPTALRNRHCTKSGVWGVIRMIEGEARLTLLDPPSKTVLDPRNPGLIQPEQPHFVTPLGAMKLRIDFYVRPPDGCLTFRHPPY